MSIEHVVLDDDQMVDRVQAARPQRREARFRRIGDQRGDVRAVVLEPIAAAISPVASSSMRFAPASMRHHVGGRPVLRDVLVPGQHPRDQVEVDAVLLLQDARAPTPRS